MPTSADTSSDPVPGDLERSLEEARAAVEADPDLAADVAMVVRHVSTTLVDPTGAPE